MWRLLAFILIFAVFLVFIVFNLDNKCNISFGFKTLLDIPVFLTVFSSFVLGMLFAVPFVISLGKRRKKVLPGSPVSPAPKKNKKLWGGNKDSASQVTGGKSGSAGTDEIKTENSSYGID